MTTNQNELKQQIQSELITSGAYTQIYNTLKIQLANSGWVEKFNNLTTETIDSYDSDEDLKFGNLVSKLEGRGLEMVDEDVKVVVLKMIKEFLKDVVAQ